MHSDAKPDDAEPSSPTDNRHDDSIAEFEQRLRAHCALAEDESAFWRHVAEDLDGIEATMDASQIAHFEISVDVMLSRLGLQAWTIVKPRMNAAGRDIP